MNPKARTRILLIIIVLQSVMICFLTSKNPLNLFSRAADINIGQTYIRDMSFDKEDPFEPKNIDTILILDKKDGYVKYNRNSDGFPYSSPEWFLKKRIIINNEK